MLDDVQKYGKALEKSQTLQRLIKEGLSEIQKHYSDEKSALGKVLREIVNQARNGRSEAMREMGLSFAEKQMFSSVASTVHLQLSSTSHHGVTPNGEET